MEYGKLGDLLVSRISYGCWAMGGHGWGKVDDNDSYLAVRKALDLGINCFDTADVYGFGHSEKILSKSLGSKRHEVVIATKVGVSWDEFGKIGRNASAQYVLNAIEDSLRRLNIDCIPLYQLHWPDPKTPIEQTFDVLKKCQMAGKIRYIGCTNLPSSLLEEASRYCDIASFQISYSLLDRKFEEEQLSNCKNNTMSVFTYGSLAKGLFSGKFNEKSVFQRDDVRNNDLNFKGEQFKKNLLLVDSMKQLGEKYNKSSAQVALRWILDTDGITSAITGIKKAAQIEENAGALGWSLAPEDYDLLAQLTIKE